MIQNKEMVEEFTRFLAMLNDEPKTPVIVDKPKLLPVTMQDIIDYKALGINIATGNFMPEANDRACKKCGVDLPKTRYYTCKTCTPALPEEPNGDERYAYFSGTKNEK